MKTAAWQRGEFYLERQGMSGHDCSLNRGSWSLELTIMFWISRALSLRHTALLSALYQDCCKFRQTHERTLHTAAHI